MEEVNLDDDEMHNSPLPSTPGAVDDAPPPMPATLPPGLDDDEESSTEQLDDGLTDLEPQVPTGPLAADDDFQALHGAVRILARQQAALSSELTSTKRQLAEAQRTIAAQQTEITSLQRSFESFKVTTLGLHEDLTREISQTHKLVASGKTPVGGAGSAAFDEIRLEPTHSTSSTSTPLKSAVSDTGLSPRHSTPSTPSRAAWASAAAVDQSSDEEADDNVTTSPRRRKRKDGESKKTKIASPRRKHDDKHKSPKRVSSPRATAAIVDSVAGFRVETGTRNPTSRFGRDPVLMYPEKYNTVYKSNFVPYKHKNYVHQSSTDPMLVCYVRKPGYDDELSVLIYTKESTDQITVKTKKNPGAKDLSNLLRSEWPPAAAGRDVSKFKHVKSPELTKKLVSFEEQNLENKFKVSVVYISEGQTTAAEMLSNIGSSLEFQKFLQLLGEHVKLQDFDGFAGDLDTVEGLTGKTSVYTKWRDLEIMYHVTLLPYDPQNSEQTTKRKYLNQNTAMIVFKDGPPALNPLELVTDVTCVLIVVELLETASETAPARYRVACVVKQGVGAFGPELPASGEFTHGEELRSFILSKVVNGVQTSMQLPEFREPYEQVRHAILNEMVRT